MKSEYQHSQAQRKHLQPLDPERLRALAVGYVGRYATSCARLTAFLERKVNERGWRGDGGAPIVRMVAEFASLGYVDDQAFATARSESLLRRGYGPNRLRHSLKESGIETEIIERTANIDDDAALAAALAFARRKRIGPHARTPFGPDIRRKMMAALLRAGHNYNVSRTVLDMPPIDLE